MSACASCTSSTGCRNIRAMPQLEPEKHNNKLTFDKVSDVYRSGTEHDEDQPPHLKVLDFNICVNRCTQEYGNPCQYFCPAAVYEVEEADGGRKPKVNFSNCVHCKTCDIMTRTRSLTG